MLSLDNPERPEAEIPHEGEAACGRRL